MTHRLAVLPAETATLKDNVGVQARQALLDFLAAQSWGKAELVQWLQGAYSRATRHSQASVFREESPTTGKRAAVASLEPMKIAELVEAAQAAVLEVLEQIQTRNIETAERFQWIGFVAKLPNAKGEIAFVAVDRPRMRLSDRVTALVVADYLNRPADYRNKLSICEHCSSVSFDRECQHADSGLHFRPDRADGSDDGETIVMEVG